MRFSGDVVFTVELEDGKWVNLPPIWVECQHGSFTLTQQSFPVDLRLLRMGELTAHVGGKTYRISEWSSEIAANRLFLYTFRVNA